MSWLLGRYHKMSAKDQKLLKLLVALVLLSAYLFWSALTWQAMFEAESMANRRANRIETRVGSLETPTLEYGVSEAALAQLTEKIAVQEAQLQYLLSDMLPLETPAPREQLKLELARLFKAHQLTLIRLSDSKNELVRDSLDHLSGESLRRHFESRPSFHLRLEGHYLNLIDFIDGLNQLSYRTYVTNMSVERQGDAGGELKIQIELRI